MPYQIIAQKADGALRDALSLFDQMASFLAQEISYKTVIENLNTINDYYFKVTDAILSNCIANTPLTIFDEILNNGFDGRHFHQRTWGSFEKSASLQGCQHAKAIRDKPKNKVKYQAQSSLSSEAFLLKALVLCNKADLQYKM